LYNAHGIGSIDSDRNPSRLVAQPIPKCSYTIDCQQPIEIEERGGDLLWMVKSGKVAPSRYLRSPLAPIAEAAVRAA